MEDGAGVSMQYEQTDGNCERKIDMDTVERAHTELKEMLSIERPCPYMVQLKIHSRLKSCCH